MFFVDIQDADVARFDAFAKQHAPDARYERVPMLRGRIVSANGVRAEDLKAPPNAAWVLQSDRGITYAGDVPAGSRVVAGEWWGPDYQGPPLVSFENKIAEGLGLKIGDPVVVNVLGRNITATLANTARGRLAVARHQFRAGLFARRVPRRAAYPYRDLHVSRAARPSSEEIALLKAAAAEFPTVTAVRVREALEAVAKVVLDLTLAIRGASADHADRRRAGAGRRARHRPSPSRLRCRGAEDARRDALPPARRLRARISADRACDRASSASRPDRSRPSW